MPEALKFLIAINKASKSMLHCVERFADENPGPIQQKTPKVDLL